LIAGSCGKNCVRLASAISKPYWLVDLEKAIKEATNVILHTIIKIGLP
jgi:hypothetical protein